MFAGIVFEFTRSRANCRCHPASHAPPTLGSRIRAPNTEDTDAAVHVAQRATLVVPKQEGPDMNLHCHAVGLSGCGEAAKA